MGFVEIYEKYHTLACDSSPLYAKILGVQILGHMLGYDSVHYIKPGEVRHNMFTALIGQSTLSRKSTSQNLAKKVFPQSLVHPNDWSPEQLLSEIADNPRNFLFYGEWTYLLKSIGNKGSYMGRTIEILNELFDCPENYRKNLRKDDEEIEINNAYLGLSTTCTPAMLERYVNEEMMHGGFFARFLIAPGTSDVKPRGRSNPEFKYYEELVKYTLGHVLTMTMVGGPLFEFDDEALLEYQKVEEAWYKKYNGCGSFVGRYLDYLVAISDILVISDLLGECMEGENFGKLGNLVNFVELVELVKLVKLVNLVKLPDIYTTKLTKLNVSTEEKQQKIILVEKAFLDRARLLIEPCLDYIQELEHYVDVTLPVKKLEKKVREEKEIDWSTAMRNCNLDKRQMDLAYETLGPEGQDIVCLKLPRGDNKRIKRILVWKGDE